jgi:PEP-CTERM motif-containing protein
MLPCERMHDTVRGFAERDAGWHYEFVPDADGILFFEYAILGEGEWSFETTGYPLEQMVGIGLLSRALVAHQAFSVSIGSTDALSCLGCSEASSGRARFHWMITPEPSTFVLVAAGMLVLARRCGRQFIG